MTVDKFSNKAEAFDDTPLSPQAGETIGAIIARSYSRRHMLKGSLGVTAATVLFGEVALIGASGPAKAASAGFAFREVTGRTPDDAERRILGKVLAADRARYKGEPEAANEVIRVGLKPVPASVDAAELAAWAGVGRVLLNLSETITRE